MSALVADGDVPKQPEAEPLSETAQADFDRSIRAFNLNPRRGVQYMVDGGIIAERPERVATFLFTTRGLNKTKIGEWLGDPADFNVLALAHFCTLFDFANASFLEALRLFLARLRLPGEAQKIDRIVEAFARAYHAVRPEDFASVDTLQILSFSTVMLNTDQHNPSIADARRMTRDEFVRNNRGIDAGKDLPQEMLEAIYASIKMEELRTIEDRDDQGNLFTNTVRQGWLRKQGGAVGGWQRRYFILTDQPPALYYFLSEKDLDPRGFFMLDTGVEVLKAAGHHKQIELVPTARDTGLPQSSLLKSAKFNARMEIRVGRHRRCVLKGADEADALLWVKQLGAVIAAAEKRALEYLAFHGPDSCKRTHSMLSTSSSHRFTTMESIDSGVTASECGSAFSASEGRRDTCALATLVATSEETAA